MAQALDGFTPARRTDYPWERWTNGRPWLAKRGDDFESDAEGFKSTLYSYARRHGLKVKTTVPNGEQVSFQFTRKRSVAKTRRSRA